MKCDSTETIRQCLADAGCGKETIAAFLKCRNALDAGSELAILEGQRAQLLNRIHETQFCIAMLDDLLRKTER